MNSINSFKWNGDAIEDAIQVGTDSVFLKGFAQKVMGLDVKELYDALASKEMPYVDRAKTEMRYRGHMLTRTKFFLTDTPDPVRIYNYTGFQYASTQHYRCYADYPRGGRTASDAEQDADAPVWEARAAAVQSRDWYDVPHGHRRHRLPQRQDQVVGRGLWRVYPIARIHPRVPPAENTGPAHPGVRVRGGRPLCAGSTGQRHTQARNRASQGGEDA